MAVLAATATRLSTTTVQENIEAAAAYFAENGPANEKLGRLTDDTAARLKSTGDGWAIPDVPVGRYKITAHHAPENAKPTPIQIRLRNKGKFADALTADFENPNGTGLAIHRIEVEVKKP